MHRIVPVTRAEDIFPRFRDTPVGRLLEYHDLGRPFEECARAQLLIGMCMDNRKHLRIPEQFAFIIRAGGANLQASEFRVSYAIAVGGVRHIAVIAHTQCGMSGLDARREAYIQGLVENGGWERNAAEEHFDRYAPHFEIGDEVEYVLGEAARLRRCYPKVLVAPLLYKVEDNLLYQLREE